MEPTSLAKQATAVIDASTAYGASRWYRGVHQDPKWEYAHKYRAEDDRRLYHEFLHNLLLYDKILLDKSSVSTVAEELRELFAKVNTRLRKELLCFDTLTDAKTLEPVQSSVCAMIKGVIEEGIKKESDLTALPIPWAYSSPHHHDYSYFVDQVSRVGLPSLLVPIAIFAYRGICYSGFANGLSQETDRPVVYLACPGRMRALTQLLDERDVANLKYPVFAYRDLVKTLKLPAAGYSFSHLKSVAASQLSEFTLAVAEQNPRDSLRFALKLRESPECDKMRRDWADRIWAREFSASVGSEWTQSVTNSNVGGPLTMIQIHGVAVD